jgi:hypothetical protein
MPLTVNTKSTNAENHLTENKQDRTVEPDECRRNKQPKEPLPPNLLLKAAKSLALGTPSLFTEPLGRRICRSFRSSTCSNKVDHRVL